MLQKNDNAEMHGRRGTDTRESETAPPLCPDCNDVGVAYFAGVLYCGRCALFRLIRALQAEVEEPAAQPSVAVHDRGILVEH